MFMWEGGMKAPMHSHNMFVGLCGMRWRKWSVVREIIVKMLLALCRRTHLAIKHAGCLCLGRWVWPQQVRVWFVRGFLMQFRQGRGLALKARRGFRKGTGISSYVEQWAFLPCLDLVLDEPMVCPSQQRCHTLSWRVISQSVSRRYDTNAGSCN